MKKVIWGVISTAKIGRERVLPGMQKSELLEIRAIASRDEGTASRAAYALGIPQVYGSYEALLADPEIEAVYNPLPNHLHVPLTLQAAAAGKHVLCEKPIALTADEATALRDAAKQVLIAEAFMVRFHPQWIRAREMVREGRIGELRAVQMFFGYNNLDPANVRNRADIGGGGLYDIGCYAVVAGRYFFAGEPDRAIALVDRDPAFRTDRMTSGLVDFGGGRRLDFTVSTQVAPHQRLNLCGTKGRIEIPIPVNPPQGAPHAHPDRRLPLARRCRHRRRGTAGERPVPAAGRSLLARGARRNRVALRDRGRDRQHAHHRRVVPLREERRVGGGRRGVTVTGATTCLLTAQQACATCRAFRYAISPASCPPSA